MKMATNEKQLPQEGTCLSEAGESLSDLSLRPTYLGRPKSARREESEKKKKEEAEKLKKKEEDSHASDSDVSVSSMASDRGRLWRSAKRRRHDDSLTASNDSLASAAGTSRAPIPVVVLDASVVEKRKEFLAKRQEEVEMELEEMSELHNTPQPKSGSDRRKEFLAKREKTNAEAELELVERVREASAMRSSLGLQLTTESCDDLTVVALKKQVCHDVDTILKVATSSKNLKGSFVRALKDSAASIKSVAEVLHKRTVTDETAKLQSENARLQREVEELRKEMEELRKEVRRGSMPPNQPAWRPSQKRMEITGLEPISSRSAESIEDFTRSIMLQVGSMMSARLEALEERLLPEKRLRPPLAADRKSKEAAVPRTEAAKIPDSTARKESKRKALAVVHKAPDKKKDSRLPAKETSKLVDALSNTKETIKKPGPRPLPSAPESMDEGWTTVVRRRGNRKAAPKRSTRLPVSAGAPKPKPKKVKNRLNAPRSAAVVITLLPGAVEKGVTYGKVLAEARRKVDLESVGIAGLRYRQAATGARMLEVPGATSDEKADSLAQKLRETLDAELVKVSRPTKCAEMRVSGLDESVSVEEVVAAVAQRGGCPEESVKFGEIRRDSRGSGAVWVRCPVTAAKKLAEGGRLLVGWVAAQVKLLEPRPLQCFKCLQRGHVRAQCTAEIDRSEECYRCGRTGHKAARCSEKPRCSLCAAANRPAEHRLGSKLCSPPKPKKGALAAAKVPAAISCPPSQAEEEEAMICN